MTELFHIHEKSEVGAAQVLCADCPPNEYDREYLEGKDGHVLAGITDSEKPCLSQVEVNYLLTIAATHQEETGHEVTIYTWGS